jgi:hypothetical protein
MAVDRHVAGRHFLVAEFGCAAVENFEVVVARQSGVTVGARDAHLGFG